MWSGVRTRLEDIFKRLRGRGLLDEATVAETLREVRLALLEADVHYKVTKELLERVRTRAITQSVLESLSPGQQVLTIVWEELTALMGQSHRPVHLAPNPPTIVMLVGLQGAGKTTTAGKIARSLLSQGRRGLLAGADLKRPAAMTQLEMIGRQIDVPVFVMADATDPVTVCRAAVSHADRVAADFVILDTAGRLQVDDALMDELDAIRAAVSPHETLMVADAMTGQTAVSIAETFDRRIGLTGIVLTKAEGDARAGAVLSMLAVTGKPIKYLGTGESFAALEPFHPDRVASRILGMGDLSGLVERARAALSEGEAERSLRVSGSERFTLEEFRAQLQQVKKLGSITDVLGMLPGGAKLAERLGDEAPDRELVRCEAIVNSMTAQERRHPDVINGSRRKRIAKGSGTRVQDVNQVLRQFAQTKRMMKTLKTSKGRGGLARLLSG